MSQITSVVSSGGGGGTLSTLTGDMGTAMPSGGNINIITNNSNIAANCGATVLITGSMANITLSIQDSEQNIALGIGAGGLETALINGNTNVILGGNAAANLNGGYSNTFIGNAVGNNIKTGNLNVGVGTGALYAQNAPTGSQSSNVAVGPYALQALDTGSFNVIVGSGSGWENGTASQYGTSESNNIILGSCTGTSGENQIMRLGNDGTVSGSAATLQTYMQGVYSNAPASAQYVTVNSSGQLGSSASAAGSFNLIQTQTANSSTSLAFTSGINGTYNSYQLVLTSFTNLLATGSANFVCQVSINGGSSWISTGYLGTLSGLVVVGGTVLSTYYCGTLYLYNLTSAAAGTYIASIGSSSIVPLPSFAGGGANDGLAAVAVNAIRLIMDDGSAFSGTFSLYGIAQ
jgi:hypothetical protein